VVIAAAVVDGILLDFKLLLLLLLILLVAIPFCLSEFPRLLGFIIFTIGFVFKVDRYYPTPEDICGYGGYYYYYYLYYGGLFDPILLK